MPSINLSHLGNVSSNQNDASFVFQPNTTSKSPISRNLNVTPKIIRIKSSSNIVERDLTNDENLRLKSEIHKLKSEVAYYKSSAIKSDGQVLKKDKHIDELLKEITLAHNNVINNNIHISSTNGSPPKYKDVRKQVINEEF